MLDSDFWRDLAEKFRALDPFAYLRAEWSYIYRHDRITWEVIATGIENRTLRNRFIPLAQRGARKLQNPGNIGLLALWLTELKKSAHNERHGSGSFTDPADGTQMAYLSGCIMRLCEESAGLCDTFESEALEREWRMESRTTPEQAPIVQASAEAAQLPSVENRNPRRDFIEPLLRQRGWSVFDWANAARVAHVIDHLKSSFSELLPVGKPDDIIRAAGVSHPSIINTATDKVLRRRRERVGCPGR